MEAVGGGILILLRVVRLSKSAGNVARDVRYLMVGELCWWFKWWGCNVRQGYDGCRGGQSVEGYGLGG